MGIITNNEINVNNEITVIINPITNNDPDQLMSSIQSSPIIELSPSMK